MGYAVVTTVLSPAARHDLTCLATVKDELSIDTADTSNDSWLCRAIRQISSAIATHTKRVFAPEFVQDRFDIQQDPYPYQTPGGFPQLQLSRWPVLGLVSVVQTLGRGAWPGGAAAEAEGFRVGDLQWLREGRDFRLDPETGRLLRLNPFTGAGTTWEAIPVTVKYTAGFGRLVEETDTVSAEAPFAVTLQASPFSCLQSVKYADGTCLTAVPGNPVEGQYALGVTAPPAAPAATLTVNEADAGAPLSVAYATAFVPPELEEIVLRLVTARFKGKDRDPALIQEDQPGLGTMRYWFGGAPGQKGPFPPDIQGLLDDYRVPTVA